MKHYISTAFLHGEEERDGVTLLNVPRGQVSAKQGQAAEDQVCDVRNERRDAICHQPRCARVVKTISSDAVTELRLISLPDNSGTSESWRNVRERILSLRDDPTPFLAATQQRK